MRGMQTKEELERIAFHESEVAESECEFPMQRPSDKTMDAFIDAGINPYDDFWLECMAYSSSVEFGKIAYSAVRFAVAYYPADASSKIVDYVMDMVGDNVESITEGYRDLILEAINIGRDDIYADQLELFSKWFGYFSGINNDDESPKGDISVSLRYSENYRICFTDGHYTR